MLHGDDGCSLYMLHICAITIVVLIIFMEMCSIDMGEDGTTFLTRNSLKLNR